MASLFKSSLGRFITAAVMLQTNFQIEHSSGLKLAPSRKALKLKGTQARVRVFPVRFHGQTNQFEVYMGYKGSASEHTIEFKSALEIERILDSEEETYKSDCHGDIAMTNLSDYWQALRTRATKNSNSEVLESSRQKHMRDSRHDLTPAANPTGATFRYLETVGEADFLGRPGAGSQRGSPKAGSDDGKSTVSAGSSGSRSTASSIASSMSGVASSVKWQHPSNVRHAGNTRYDRETGTTQFRGTRDDEYPLERIFGGISDLIFGFSASCASRRK